MQVTFCEVMPWHVAAHLAVLPAVRGGCPEAPRGEHHLRRQTCLAWAQSHLALLLTMFSLLQDKAEHYTTSAEPRWALITDVIPWKTHYAWPPWSTVAS
jgi:hypothetical protein